MPAHRFTATAGLRVSLEEVECLLRTAEAAADERLFSCLNKAALLLLSGKFEAFAEALAEEFVFSVNKLAPPPLMIPARLRVSHTLLSLRNLDQLRALERQAEVERLFTSLVDLWKDPGPAPELRVECRFSYGKHGEEEVRKLFQTISEMDVFEDIVIEREVESMLPDAAATARVDVRGALNSVTHMRNNILHQDATPSLTVDRVREFMDVLSRFADGLDARLARELDGIAERCGRDVVALGDV